MARGLLSEINRMAKQAAREAEREQREAERGRLAAARRAEQARKAEERAAKQLARAREQERKRLENFGREPGEFVVLRFHFGGEDGQEIGTMEISLKMPGKRESVDFEALFRTSARTVGFRYGVVG